MTKEEAIKILREQHDQALFSVRTALETLIPELRESEDERIRKRIYLCLDECVHSDIIRDYERDECLAYLEKQKEQKPTLNWRTIEQATTKRTDEGDCVTTERMLIKGLIDDEDYRIIDKDVMVNKNLLCIPVSELNAKEQKPVKKLSKEDYVKKFKALCDAYEIKLPNREYDIYHLCNDLSKLSLEPDRQKPEWSEEDEKMLARIIERGQSQIQMFETGLLPEHINWLKSLRPQPHWKPSEEQMEALETAKRWYSDNMGCSRELESLWDQLNKL